VRLALALSCAILLTRVAPLAAAASSADRRDSFFEYLHIEANSGSASGGHAAICFGDRCFHFQQGEDRTIRLHRETAARLNHAYRALGNRTIHVSRVPVPSDVRARDFDAFEDLYRRQQRDVDRAEALRQDGRLLSQLADELNGDASGKAKVRVPGSAYFLDDERSDAARVSTAPASGVAFGSGRSPVIERVAHRIRARYGPDSLETRSAALGEAVRDLLG